MATRNLTSDDSTGKGRGVTWTGLLNGDQGDAFDTLVFADMSVQIQGTFGAGGTIVFEGTNQADPTTATFYTLNDPQANPLSFTSAKIEQLREITRWVRPRVTAGDGTTSLAVYLWARRSL